MSKQNLTISANHQLKEAFNEMRIEIIGSGKETLSKFSDFVIETHPEYNCREGIDRIRNTFYGRCADYKLTEIMKEYKAHLNL